MIPQVGERWRWSFCDGPDWCCGNEGVIVAFTTYKGRDYAVVQTDDATGHDEFSPQDPDVLRMEQVT